MMMKRGGSKKNLVSGSSGKDEADLIEWEMRPGGMLVQKRDPNADPALKPPPNVKLRVTYGTSKLEISISLQTTFGELKKLLAIETGLQPHEQRLIFRGKERDSSDYLDISGVKDKSKIVLIEDPSSRERKYIEMKRNAKIESACKAISEICGEVDKLAEQVRNAMPKSLLDHSVVVTTKWETFEPAPSNSSLSTTAKWELFD